MSHCHRKHPTNALTGKPERNRVGWQAPRCSCRGHPPPKAHVPHPEPRTDTGITLRQGDSRMSVIESNSYLLQQDLVADYPRCLIRDGWITLYRKAVDGSACFESSSALASPDNVPKMLRDCQWDLQPDRGMPELSGDFSGTEPTYHRYGNNKGMRPIVFLREFAGLRPDYLELAESFRLYHNLAEIPDPADKDQRTFFKIEEGGERVEVARVTRDAVSVKSPFLHMFLKATNLCLALYVDSRRHASVPIDAIPESDRERFLVNDTARWEVRVGEHWDPHSHGSYSRFLGKAIVRGSANGAPSPAGEA